MNDFESEFIQQLKLMNELLEKIINNSRSNNEELVNELRGIKNILLTND